MYPAWIFAEHLTLSHIMSLFMYWTDVDLMDRSLGGQENGWMITLGGLWSMS